MAVAMLYGLLAGLLVGIIPIVYGASKGRFGMGLGGFFACAVSGLFLGLLLAVPVCGVFVWLIAKNSFSLKS